MRTIFILLILGIANIPTDGQVLISILLGDKLNSDKLEFGLEGGLSLCTAKVQRIALGLDMADLGTRVKGESPPAAIISVSAV